jgi:uncharacterized damage-inducible protein DinB
MNASLLSDAFAHHIWATERLIDACTALTSEQLKAAAPGTYGSIIATLTHLVEADCWYLTFFREGPQLVNMGVEVGLEELRAAITSNGSAWLELLAGEIDSDADVVERAAGLEFHAPVGLRLAQAVHHGTDHRSQVCTALTNLGVMPPEIDLWSFGEATGRTREATAPAP